MSSSTQGIGILKTAPQRAGCTDSSYLEYNELAEVDDGSCVTGSGCMDPLYLEYDANAIIDDGSCATLIVNGCTEFAVNYNAAANVDDGSCFVPGLITWRTSHMNTTTTPSTGPTWRTNHEVSWTYTPINTTDAVPDSYEYEGVDHARLTISAWALSWPNNVDPTTPIADPATVPYSQTIYSGNLAFPVITDYDPTAPGGPLNFFHYRVRWVKNINNVTYYGPWVGTEIQTI